MSSDNPDTRVRILNAALKLLEASQGKGVRMTDIAKEAGISRQALEEVIIHVAHYAGWPTGVGAARVLAEIWPPDAD